MPDKPLIALLTNNDDDVYCFRLELIQGILNAGYRLIISCPNGPKFDVMEEAGLRKNEKFIYDDPPIDRRGTNPFSDWKLICHYHKLFKTNKPSIILTYTAKPNVYATMSAHIQHIPVICNVTGLGSVEKTAGIKKKFILWLYRMAYRKADCIMFQNETNMKMAEKNGWIRKDYQLIPGSGVALNRFPVLDYPAGGNGFEGAPVVFNYIGRILHDKGVDDYIEAAKRIKNKYPNTEFNLLGFIEPTEKHYEQELSELEKHGTVFYRGSQKDIRPWIGRSHCTIHPSTYGEGMSNVLLESAASGRPLITTDNPGCQETVINGKTGFIYSGGNVDALCGKIEAFLAMKNGTRKQMGEAGRVYMESRFSRTIVVDAYLKEIQAILSKRGKNNDC